VKEVPITQSSFAEEHRSIISQICK